MWIVARTREHPIWTALPYTEAKHSSMVHRISYASTFKYWSRACEFCASICNMHILNETFGKVQAARPLMSIFVWFLSIRCGRRTDNEQWLKKRQLFVGAKTKPKRFRLCASWAPLRMLPDGITQLAHRYLVAHRCSLQDDHATWQRMSSCLHAHANNYNKSRHSKQIPLLMDRSNHKDQTR